YLQAAGGGLIVNLGCAGVQNLVAWQKITPYAIAKHGIIIYTKSLAKELAPQKITVNVVSPGVVENSVNVAKFSHQLPTRRAATLQELTNAVWFFVNPEADYLTGQILEVAGGCNL
ncbi:MAG: SDR family oxidoreductase, partial [Okeania sp. SIO2D1]|nr:SDR family oxidoreductase [Okeania sp. SIO2D1]